MKKLLQANEEILLAKENIEVKADNNNFSLTLFITNKRLILLKDINKDLEYNKFLATRLISIPSNNEVVFTTSLSDIKEFNYHDKINKIVLKNNHQLLLYCEDLTPILERSDNHEEI